MDAVNEPDALFAFDNSYARLSERFFARLDPTPVHAPNLLRVNDELARMLGLDPQQLTARGVDIFSGNRVPAGASPLAMAYAGHQFGGWVPQLGDGRAILLGEVLASDGERYDVQLKGAGQTPFSRGGDGRAALGPVLREYIVSEAMNALGIRTTRALAAVTTGEWIMRDKKFPGAVLTRVASSHVRIGTFQYFEAKKDHEAVRELADYIIARHYPYAASRPNPYRALLDAVIRAQAVLVASWMHIGFIHGVMNTDNMQVAGETIDYGPCAFMDRYDAGTVFSSIDEMGRYAYGNQPAIAHWNLAQFAQSLLLLLGDNEEAAIFEAQEAIATYGEIYEEAWLKGMRQKLGLFEKRQEDRELIEELLDLMAQNRADFTLTFRGLSTLSLEPNENDEVVRDLFDLPASIDDWLVLWRQRLAQENSKDTQRIKSMRAKNPAFIPRNHLVEQVIQAALEGNFDPFHQLMSILATPFDDQPDAARFALPPKPEEIVRATFCGT